VLGTLALTAGDGEQTVFELLEDAAATNPGARLKSAGLTDTMVACLLTPELTHFLRLERSSARECAAICRLGTSDSSRWGDARGPGAVQCRSPEGSELDTDIRTAVCQQLLSDPHVDQIEVQGDT
jgi:hypothetical protein